MPKKNSTKQSKAALMNILASHLKVTLVRSLAGHLPNHKACVNGLGLRRIGQSAVVQNNPCILGMIKKTAYLLKVEPVQQQ